MQAKMTLQRDDDEGSGDVHGDDDGDDTVMHVAHGLIKPFTPETPCDRQG